MILHTLILLASMGAYASAADDGLMSDSMGGDDTLILQDDADTAQPMDMMPYEHDDGSLSDTGSNDTEENTLTDEDNASFDDDALTDEDGTESYEGDLDVNQDMMSMPESDISGVVPPIVNTNPPMHPDFFDDTADMANSDIIYN